MCREREEEQENIKLIKGDTTVTSSAQNIRLETEFGTKNKMEENVFSEEELDCSSFTESSGYQRKMAELNEKSRRLKAQFAEENRQAVESMNKTMQEIKQSQAREDCITNEIEEIRRRRDEIKEDLKRLDEIGQRRELKDKKWREKMDMKKKKLANILEKIRAKRHKYQEETGAENDSTEGHDQQDKNSSESPESEKSKDVTIGNETVINEDVGNEVLREPHQIIEYKSVKELEEKRKELKQLKRLEKKAIKREKLEQRERKKIEKHKLEKLLAKSSKVSEETAGVAGCINQDMEATNTTAKEKSAETPKVTRIKPYVDTSSHIAESKQVQAPYYSGLITNGTRNKVEENVFSEEELDCSSFTESSGYQRKIAELDEKSRRLKAQFAKENRQAVESTNKTMEEIKQSQAREDCITNEIEEIQRRRDEIKENLKRLDEKLGETFAEVDRLILGDTDSMVDETADSQQSNPKYSKEEVPRQDNFDCFPDEVEGDMHTEESRSQVSQSAENEDNEKNVHECDALPKYEQSVAAVVNITEYLIQQGLSEALETIIPVSKKEYTLRSEEKISEEEPKLHKENVEMEFGKLKRENTELEMQICIINEELETYRKRIETLQADLDGSKVEVEQLQSKEEYKERELANLKSDFQRKEQKWEDANELLEKVMVEREELWDDVDYLEESLKDSQESNETLTFEVDELTIMIQEMKREYRVEHSRWGCGHLREEVELLNGSLELNEQRTVLLESQLDAFEAERKQLCGHVDFLEGSLRNSQESNKDLTFEVDELKIMMQELKKENTKLSRHGSRHLREEVELLNGSLELKEQRVTLLESQVDAFKEESCSFQNVTQSMKREIEIVKKENVTKTTQLHKLKCETSQTISDLKDDIAKLQQEKSALSSELSKESEKDHHLYELRCEKSSVTKTLEDHLTRLRRENCTLTARLSKAYEKDDQLIELREKVQLLENQLKNVTEAATASVNSKEKEMEEDYRIIKKQDETIKNLIEEITQERCDKDRLEQQYRRIRELETQLQKMEDMKRNTNHSVDALVLEVKQERSEKERLKKRAMQANKVGSCREKELEKRIELLEDQLRAEDELTNATLMSLNNKESSLQEATATIDMLTKELEREKSGKKSLRKAVEVSECNSHNDKRLTENIETLLERLQEMSDLREKTLVSLKEKKWSLQEAHDEISELTQQIAHKKSHKKFFKRKAKAKTGKAYRLNLIQKGTKRYTQERGSFIAGVGKRLKNLVQRPRGVSASSLVMKKKEAYAERVLDKLRDDLNEKGEVIQDLRSNFKDTAEELSSMRRQLEDIQCQNAELIQCLGHKEEDLQKTQRYLKEKEASLDVTNETLRLKCSLLRAMEAKLCLTKKEIEELTQVNKEKGLEITRIETTLTEVRKKLVIAASFIEKQNEQCANLRTCAMKKTRDADKMQGELKRFSTQLENSRNENANLHRALLAATERLTREKHRQFSRTELLKDGHERKSSESSREVRYFPP